MEYHVDIGKILVYNKICSFILMCLPFKRYLKSVCFEGGSTNQKRMLTLARNPRNKMVFAKIQSNLI